MMIFTKPSQSEVFDKARAILDPALDRTKLMLESAETGKKFEVGPTDACFKFLYDLFSNREMPERIEVSCGEPASDAIYPASTLLYAVFESGGYRVMPGDWIEFFTLSNGRWKLSPIGRAARKLYRGQFWTGSDYRKVAGKLMHACEVMAGTGHADNARAGVCDFEQLNEKIRAGNQV